MPSGYFSRKIYRRGGSINYISIAAGNYAVAYLEKMVHIPGAIRLSRQVPRRHHSPRLSCQLSAPADLLIEEHLHTRGPGNSQQIQDR